MYLLAMFLEHTINIDSELVNVGTQAFPLQFQQLRPYTSTCCTPLVAC